jgi:hypothetical protein
MTANRLSQEPPNSVAHDRRPDSPADPKANPNVTVLLFPQQHEATNGLVREHPPACKDSGESPVPAKSFPVRPIGSQWRTIGLAPMLTLAADR